jgi:hypothetical protein
VQHDVIVGAFVAARTVERAGHLLRAAAYHCEANDDPRTKRSYAGPGVERKRLA